MNYFVSDGRVFTKCGRCLRVLRVRSWGSPHICVTDCQLAGYHQQTRIEWRGWWLRKSMWSVCDDCGYEKRLA